MSSYDKDLIIFHEPHFLGIESGEKNQYPTGVGKCRDFFVNLVSERFPEERVTLQASEHVPVTLQ